MSESGDVVVVGWVGGVGPLVGRFGMTKMKESVLMLASFEKTVPLTLRSALTLRPLQPALTSASPPLPVPLWRVPLELVVEPWSRVTDAVRAAIVGHRAQGSAR